MTTLGYLEACAAATVSAGLHIVSAALSNAGVPHVIEQTGGMTMVLYVPTRGTARLGVAEGDGPDGWSICTYTHEDDDGRSIDPDAKLQTVVTAARLFVANPARNLTADLAYVEGSARDLEGLGYASVAENILNGATLEDSIKDIEATRTAGDDAEAARVIFQAKRLAHSLTKAFRS